MKIAVIGDGGWGTANAILLCGYGHDVTVWGAFPDYIDEQKRTRRNDRFLKGVTLPDSLKLTSDREEAVKGADIVVLAPPSKYFAPVMEGFKGLVTNEQLVVSLTKGLCEHTNKRMTVLAREILGVTDVVALAGPTHAEEVSRGIPTTIVAACDDIEKAKKVQKVWSGPLFRVYTSTDPVGVEIGGAEKLCGSAGAPGPLQDVFSHGLGIAGAAPENNCHFAHTTYSFPIFYCRETASLDSAKPASRERWYASVHFRYFSKVFRAAFSSP